jgi:hypothetical protein
VTPQKAGARSTPCRSGPSAIRLFSPALSDRLVAGCDVYPCWKLSHRRPNEKPEIALAPAFVRLFMEAIAPALDR